MVVTCFALHKAAVELPQVLIFESFAQTFEPLATAGFDEREDQQSVQEALFFGAAFYLEFHQLAHVKIFSLAAQF